MDAMADIDFLTTGGYNTNVVFDNNKEWNETPERIDEEMKSVDLLEGFMDDQTSSIDDAITCAILEQVGELNNMSMDSIAMENGTTVVSENDTTAASENGTIVMPITVNGKSMDISELTARMMDAIPTQVNKRKCISNKKEKKGRKRVNRNAFPYYGKPKTAAAKFQNCTLSDREFARRLTQLGEYKKEMGVSNYE